VHRHKEILVANYLGWRRYAAYLSRHDWNWSLTW